MGNDLSFKIGDRLAFSVQFLKSIGMCHTGLAAKRGIVLETFKRSGAPDLVEVLWDDFETQKVLASNLAHVGPNDRFCAC